MSIILLQVGVIYSCVEHSRLDEIDHAIHEFWKDEDFKIPVSTLFPTSASFSCLDVGCGTGDWIRRVEEKFKNCKVKGIDLSPPCWDIEYEVLTLHSLNCVNARSLISTVDTRLLNASISSTAVWLLVELKTGTTTWQRSIV